MTDPPAIWNAQHRRVLIVLTGAALCLFAWRAASHRMHVDDPMPLAMPRSDELADRIDPNTADHATLAALPQIGPKRAQDIIDHRARWLSAPDGVPAFRSAEDLMRIRGIGPNIVNHLRPHLIFPDEPVTSSPGDDEVTPTR
jgi:hypothetical protein